MNKSESECLDIIYFPIWQSLALYLGFYNTDDHVSRSIIIQTNIITISVFILLGFRIQKPQISVHRLEKCEALNNLGVLLIFVWERGKP